MCGIHGFVNGSAKAEINSDDFVKSGFLTNMVRGIDSAGMAVINNTGNYKIAKLPTAGLYLLQDRNAAKVFPFVRTHNTATICHVRAATVGNISYTNTHPFTLTSDDGETLIGVHNGTLTGWEYKEGAKAYDVDSHWAMSRILKDGADAFELFNGAFAMVWWRSSTPSTLYMARNKQRPMHVAFTKDGNMVYASEAGMLHWLCERHNIELVGAIHSLEEDKLYAFDINKPTMYKKSNLPSYKTTVAQTRINYDSYQTNSMHNQLKDLFGKIRDEEESQPVGKSTATVTQIAAPKARADDVTYEEFQDAYTLGVLGNAGSFTVYGADDATGNLYGEFVSDSYAGGTSAVMRTVPDDADWTTGEVYKVRVRGIVDNGNDYILVVSPPTEVIGKAGASCAC